MAEDQSQKHSQSRIVKICIPITKPCTAPYDSRKEMAILHPGDVLAVTFSVREVPATTEVTVTPGLGVTKPLSEDPSTLSYEAFSALQNIRLRDLVNRPEKGFVSVGPDEDSVEYRFVVLRRGKGFEGGANFTVVLSADHLGESNSAEVTIRWDRRP